MLAVGGVFATAVHHRCGKYLGFGNTQRVIGIIRWAKPDEGARQGIPVVVMSLGVAQPHILMFLGFDFSLPWSLMAMAGQIWPDLPILDQDIIDLAGQPPGESRGVAHAAAGCPIHLQAI